MTNSYKLSTLQEWKINRNVQNSNGSFNAWIFVLLVVNVQRSKPFHLCLIEKLSKIPLHKTSAAKWGWLISQRVNFIFDQPEFGGILSNVFESPPPLPRILRPTVFLCADPLTLGLRSQGLGQGMLTIQSKYSYLVTPDLTTLRNPYGHSNHWSGDITGNCGRGTVVKIPA